MSYLKTVLMLTTATSMLYVAAGTVHAQQNTSRSASKDKVEQQMISKQEAKMVTISSAADDPDFKNDPAKAEIMICTVNSVIDEVFGTAQALEVTTFKNQLATRLKEMSEDERNLLIIKCMVNSQAFSKAMKEKSAGQSSASPSPAIPILDMDDLRVDIASLNGKKVRVRGVGYYMMDMFMLKKSMSDMSPMFVDTSKLVREQRKEIISRCGDVVAGCNLIVQGTVGKVSYQNGLMAEHVEFR